MLGFPWFFLYGRPSWPYIDGQVPGTNPYQVTIVERNRKFPNLEISLPNKCCRSILLLLRLRLAVFIDIGLHGLRDVLLSFGISLLG